MVALAYRVDHYHDVFTTHIHYLRSYIYLPWFDLLPYLNVQLEVRRSPTRRGTVFAGRHDRMSHFWDGIRVRGLCQVVLTV